MALIREHDLRLQYVANVAGESSTPFTDIN